MKQKWNLDCIFEGGSESEALQLAFRKTKEKLERFGDLLKGRQEIKHAIELTQEISIHLREMAAFIICLSAQNVFDSKAELLQDQITSLNAKFSNLSIQFDEWISSLAEEDFESLLQEEDLKLIAFPLKERRELSAEKLSSQEESFINDLGVDGYHGWSQMWDALIGNLTFPFQKEMLSFGQIENKMASSDRKVRKEAFESIKTLLQKNEILFSQILNHLAGYRLAAYRKRDWQSVLKEPLQDNRMQEATLEAIWTAIEKHHGKLLDYLKCKAHLLQVPQLSWFDLEAPLGGLNQKITFDEAGAFIIKHFSRFSPKMGAFARDVLHSDWTEAENRPGKRPGGFCVGLPLAKKSRIFMTYDATINNLFTLAHELGHAFHNEISFSLPEMTQHTRMNVAETASTMAEMIVGEAAIQEASDEKERLLLLDDSLSRSVAYFMNIYARFLFETRYYEERKKGFVQPKQLNSLMEEAQRKAYCNALSEYHPHFWAAKMHFYLADAPFYNFPYTFGYLFSLGIYEAAKSKKNFEDAYIELLKDTGRMNVEDLARKHLNADLSKSEFWERAMNPIFKNIDAFSKAHTRFVEK